METTNEHSGRVRWRLNCGRWPQEPDLADSQRFTRYAGSMKAKKTREVSIYIALCTALIVAFLPSVNGAQSATTLHVIVQVTDATGTRLPRVAIRLVPSPDPAPSKMETDERGQLAVDLKPGGYGLFVNFRGFEPIASHIDVKPTRDVQTVPIQLEIGGPTSPGVILDEVAPVDELRVSAYTKSESLKLKVADLKAMPRTTVSVHNEHSKADETYAGVRLADLLAKVGAPLGHDLRGVGLSAYIVATGSDGYVAVIALAEADPSFHSGEVIVADTMNGAPLDAKSGPFKLVVTEDKRPARWVRNLITIELKSAR
jgi:hypothetical protein